MPNYVFSGPMLKKGFSIGRYAEAMHKVMLALGYDEYVTQGEEFSVNMLTTCYRTSSLSTGSTLWFDPS